MDMIIEFFRDTLDGPFYIVWVGVLVILIFACIGYLAEKGINKKKEKEKYATVNDTANTETIQDAVVSEPRPNTTQVDSTPTSSFVAEPVVTTNVNTSSPVGEVSMPVSEVAVSNVQDTSVVTPQVTNNVTPQAQVQTQQSDVTNVENNNSTTEVDNNVVIPTINQDVNNKS